MSLAINSSLVTFGPCLPHEKIHDRCGNYKGEVHSDNLNQLYFLKFSRLVLKKIVLQTIFI